MLACVSSFDTGLILVPSVSFKNLKNNSNFNRFKSSMTAYRSKKNKYKSQTVFENETVGRAGVWGKGGGACCFVCYNLNH